MKVNICYRVLDNKSKSIYLDYYQNGKRIREFLKLYISNGKSKEIQQKNKETKELAEQIAHKRAIDIMSSDNDMVPAFKKNVDFITYYQKFLTIYSNKDYRIVKYSLHHFILFLNSKNIKTISIRNINEDLCKEFRNYLENAVNGETVYNYYSKFKKVLRQAIKDKLINDNPADRIKNIKNDGLKKAILSIDEIQRMAKIECNNNEVKRAFLFSLNTGLRFVDIKSLAWSNIDLEAKQMTLTQSKVKHSSGKAQLFVDLNKTAMMLLGDKLNSNQLVFNLPSINSTLKSLKKWAKNSNIDKNITFHSARHSYAVNLLRPDVAGADIKTVSSLLGHSSLRHTEKYLRVVDELRKKAVNKLPDIIII